MKEICIKPLVAKIGIIILTMFFFYLPAMAKDWNDLDTMAEPELTKQITEFQRELDRNPADYETIKDLGIAYHIKSREDAKKFASKAIDMLTRAFEINKKDYVTLCYLGSATTMMAKTTRNPMKKSSYANKGIAMMDKAVKKDPDNVSVRLTRAFNSKTLPSFLERSQVALEDFEHLAGLIHKNPGISNSTKKIVYTNLAELYHKAGDDEKADRYKKMAEGL
jgi:tetratricopeptide (TPR) repeat protein